MAMPWAEMMALLKAGPTETKMAVPSGVLTVEQPVEQLVEKLVVELAVWWVDVMVVHWVALAGQMDTLLG